MSRKSKFYHMKRKYPTRLKFMWAEISSTKKINKTTRNNKKLSMLQHKMELNSSGSDSSRSVPMINLIGRQGS